MIPSSANPLYWDDAYPIALLLRRAHPEADPLTLDAGALKMWVTGLADFADDPTDARETWLRYQGLPLPAIDPVVVS